MFFIKFIDTSLKILKRIGQALKRALKTMLPYSNIHLNIFDRPPILANQYCINLHVSFNRLVPKSNCNIFWFFGIWFWPGSVSKYDIMFSGVFYLYSVQYKTLLTNGSYPPKPEKSNLYVWHFVMWVFGNMFLYDCKAHKLHLLHSCNFGNTTLLTWGQYLCQIRVYC